MTQSITPPPQKKMNAGRNYLAYIISALLCLPAGTACHEIIGHGLVGVLCGGRVTYVEILGMQVWPTLHWGGFPDVYGRCGVVEIPTSRGHDLMALGGSMSTWFMSVLAVILLWCRRWRGWMHAVLLSVGTWWIDPLTYTLPTWGLRRSVFWGRVYSEPYEAATGLGIPGPLFQGFVVATCTLLAAAWVLRLVQRPARSST